MFGASILEVPGNSPAHFSFLGQTQRLASLQKPFKVLSIRDHSRRVGMLIRGKISVSLLGGLRDVYVSQNFPEENQGEGKLLLRLKLAVALGISSPPPPPPRPWLGASMEKHL